MVTELWIQQVATSPNQCICPLKWSLHRKYYMNMLFCKWDCLSVHQYGLYYFPVFSIFGNILKYFMACRQLNAMLCNTMELLFAMCSSPHPCRSITLYSESRNLNSFKIFLHLQSVTKYSCCHKKKNTCNASLTPPIPKATIICHLCERIQLHFY